MKSHKDMDVWSLAIDFAENIYSITREYPREEIWIGIANAQSCGFYKCQYFRRCCPEIQEGVYTIPLYCTGILK